MKNDKGQEHPVGDSGAPGGAPTGDAGGAIGETSNGGGPTEHDVAAAVEPEIEDEYWSTHFQSRPYVRDGADYEAYRDAFRYGWESRIRTTSTWDEAVADLEQGWDEFKGDSELAWQDVREAVRDAWNRVGRAMTGDADRDGR